jgi:hypothetical protein
MKRILLFVLGLLVWALFVGEVIAPLLMGDSQQRIERAWSQGNTGR